MARVGTYSCHLSILVIFLIVFTIIVGATGANYLMKREVTCKSYINSGNAHANIVDHAGLEFVGDLEPGSFHPTLPQTCWVDINGVTTFNNPATVLMWSIIGILIAYGITIFITFFICIGKTRKEIHTQCEGYSFDSYGSSDLSRADVEDCCLQTWVFYGCLLLTVFIIALIVFAVYYTHSREVNCQGMVKCHSDSSLYQCFKYEDNQGITGIVDLDNGSRLPSDFPTTGWLIGTEITFHNPKWLGIWFTTIFFSLLAIFHIYMLIFGTMSCYLNRIKRIEEEEKVRIERERLEAIEKNKLDNLQRQKMMEEDKYKLEQAKKLEEAKKLEDEKKKHFVMSSSQAPMIIDEIDSDLDPVTIIVTNKIDLDEYHT